MKYALGQPDCGGEARNESPSMLRRHQIGVDQHDFLFIVLKDMLY